MVCKINKNILHNWDLKSHGVTNAFYEKKYIEIKFDFQLKLLNEIKPIFIDI